MDIFLDYSFLFVSYIHWRFRLLSTTTTTIIIRITARSLPAPYSKRRMKRHGNWVSRERLGVYLESSYEVETSFTLLDSEDRSSRCHFLFVFLSLHFFFHVFFFSSPMSIYASTNTNTNTNTASSFELSLLSSAILLCFLLLFFFFFFFVFVTHEYHIRKCLVFSS